MNKPIVIAIGGNSLIKRRDKQSEEAQYAALCETMSHVAAVAASGRQLLITHGNGPQVGFIMLRSEIARAATGLRMASLDGCGADIQGSIGYQIAQALGNALRRRDLPADRLAALITRARVAADDPAFAAPNKCVGEWYDDAQVPGLARLHPSWTLKRDAGRGWRRVVPSPEPLEILELPAIKTLLDAGFHVTAAGGGGIPVVETPDGLQGVEAVIDQDLSTALLANAVGAELLLMSTAAERVCLDFGAPAQKPLDRVSADEMERRLAEGHFPPDSMGPKIAAALRFLRHGGREAILTRPEHMREALDQGAGTHIFR